MKKKDKCRIYQKIAVIMAVALLIAPLEITSNGIAVGRMCASAAGTARVLTPEPLGNENDAAGGSRTMPFEIATAGQLLRMQQLINDNPDTAAASGVKYSEAAYKLTADIVINSGKANEDGSFTTDDGTDPLVWQPIRRFAGSFDGNGHIVSGLYLTSDSAEKLDSDWKVLQDDEGFIRHPKTGSGLFGSTINHAEIKNLTVSNSSILLESNTCETAHFAFITGYGKQTTLSNCKITKDCYINAKGMAWEDELQYWLATDEEWVYYDYNTIAGIGGIAGMLFDGSIQNCQNAASITCQNIRLVGGIAGYTNTSSVMDSSNSGGISGNQLVGGITGMSLNSSANITNCQNSGEVIAEEWTQEFYDTHLASYDTWFDYLLCGDMAGGISGYSGGKISNCLNTGDISGTRLLGGIAGVARENVSNSMNEGNITAKEWNMIHLDDKQTNDFWDVSAGCKAGGIIGSLGTSSGLLPCSDVISIENCSNIGEINAENASTEQFTKESSYGGILGWSFFRGSYSTMPTESSAPSSVPSAAPSDEPSQNLIVPTSIVACYTAANGQPESVKAFSSQVDIERDEENGIYPVSVTDSVYLASATNDNGGRTREQFANGEVAYELNKAVAEQSPRASSGVIWQQRLKATTAEQADTWPVSYRKASDDLSVYKAAIMFQGQPVIVYFNPGWTLEEIIGQSTLPKLTDGEYLIRDSQTKEIVEKDTVIREDCSFTAEVTYSVKVIVPKDSHMIWNADSGKEIQAGLTGEMVPVVCTAEKGYYFPENYCVASSKGITVTRNSDTQITIAGVPETDVIITLVAASAIAPDETKAPVIVPPAVEDPILSSKSPAPSPVVTPKPSTTVEPTKMPVPSSTPKPVKTPEPSLVPTTKPSETAEPSTPVTQAPKPSEKPLETTAPSNGVDFKKGGVTYKISSSNTVTMSKIPAKDTKVSLKIPDKVTKDGKTYRVTEIGAKAFADNEKIKTLVIGNSITKIGNKAFKNCKNLKKITLSKNLRTINKESFAGCKNLKSIAIPDSVQIIQAKAFKNCTDLTKVTIGTTRSDRKKGGAAGITTVTSQIQEYGALNLNLSLGNSAFENCKNLKSVIINSAVSVIGNSAFKNCVKLSDIIVRSLILKTVAKKALVGVSNCKISVPTKKFQPYRKLFKNKGQGKKVFVAKA